MGRFSSASLAASSSDGAIQIMWALVYSGDGGLSMPMGAVAMASRDELGKEVMPAGQCG